MRLHFKVLLPLFLLQVNTATTRRVVKRVDPTPKILSEFRNECGKVPTLQSHEALESQPTLVRFGEIPWQVGIFYAPDDSFLCSGTLISNEHVLTAAVCLVSIESRGDLILRIGDWDISGQDSPYEAYKEFRTVPKKVVFLQEDEGIEVNPSLRTVALLVMKESVDFTRYPHVTPICLPSLVQSSPGQKASPEEVNSTCSVSGWGHQESLDTTLLGSPVLPDDYKPKLDTPDVHSNQSGRSSEGDDDKIPRSLTLITRQESPGPTFLSIPLLYSKRAQEAYAALEPSGEFNLDQRNPSAADLLVDEYFKSNFPEGIDPVVNEEFELLSPRGPLTTESSSLVLLQDSWETSTTETIAEDKSMSNTLLGEFALHESMFRHKQKYKKGKQSRRKSVPEENPDEEQPRMSEDSEDEVVDVDKRNELPELSSKFPPPPFPLPNCMVNIVQERLSLKKGFILKEGPVTIQRSCEVIPGTETGESSLGKACVTPPDPAAPPESLCMADLGSPITCKTPIENVKRRKTRSISTSSFKQLKEPVVRISSSNQKPPPETRFVLFGIVTWKRPCYARDEFYLQKFTFVTETEEFLPILVKTLLANEKSTS